MCKGFSKAILRHVDFSKGLYFQEDLKKLNELMEAEGFDGSARLDFSYNLDANMKINLDQINKQDRERKEAMAKVGEEKNEMNFEKMKDMMGGEKPNQVFEYKPQEADDEIGKELEIDMEEEIKSDFEDEDDDPLEYSAEHLEEFMSELKRQEPEVHHTQQSDQLISNFLNQVSTWDPNRTSGKSATGKKSIASTWGGPETISNSLAYSPTNASPKRLIDKMESIESAEEESGESSKEPQSQVNPNNMAKYETREIMAWIQAERDEDGVPPLECSKLFESQDVVEEMSGKEGMQRYLA